MTPDRHKELQDEMTWLRTVREREVADLIREARSFGDLSENSEYEAAKNEQEKLYVRMAEVDEILANAVIIDPSEFDGTTVRLGCSVKVLDKEMEEELTLQIVGSQEADPKENRISEESPLGKALVGHAVGDVVTVDAPAGAFLCEILEVTQ